MLDRQLLRTFAERGFVVVPQVVPQALLASASDTIDELLGRDPPPRDVQGPHFYFLQAVATPALLALLTASRALALGESLTATGRLEIHSRYRSPSTIRPTTTARAVTISTAPPRRSRTGDRGPSPCWSACCCPTSRATTGQPVGLAGHPPDPLGVLPRARPGRPAGLRWLPADSAAAPEQVRGRAGDLLLAHYLLAHNIGGNTSDTVRRAVYFRVKRVGHAARWRQFLQDALLDYDAVRNALI